MSRRRHWSARWHKQRARWARRNGFRLRNLGPPMDWSGEE